jgi:hypothetical protein
VNHFIAGILRIVLLEASVALLAIERLVPLADTVRRARRRWASYAVAGLAVLAFTNFGQLPGQGRLVHAWEQYHFFMGAKYLREVGYFDLYRATLLADRESVQVLREVERTRDLHDFSLIGVVDALRDADRVRGRFSDLRWEEFKADWARLSRWNIPWADAVSDHGNSGSPAWAVVALPMVELLGCSPVGQTLLGSLDLVLMLVLFVVLFRSFGAEAGAIGLTIWALVPFCFDYLAGSLLRWDWLFALGMAFACWRRDRPLAAGGFFGYATVSKLFRSASWLRCSSGSRRDRSASDD